MAGPWEQYQRAEPSGPWQKYKALPKDDSAARGFGLGATKPLDNIARAVSSIPVIGPAIDAGNRALGLPTGEEAYQANQQARANNTRTGFQLAGNIAGTLPTAAIPGGALAQGAAGGALLSDAETAGGVVADAAIGAGVGRAVQGGVNAIRSVAAPRVNAFVQQLSQAGVQMTPGQIVGGIGKRIEDAATSIPFVGDAIKGAQRRSVETFNRAAVNRALAPLGQALPDNIPTGSEAVRFAGDVLSRGYDDVLQRLGGQADPTFTTRLGTIQARANLPAAEQAQLAEIVNREVVERIGQGQFTGRMLNQVRDRLDKVGAGLRANTQSPYARDLGEAVEAVREQVMALARRQNPTFADALRSLDKGWSNLVRVEKAAANAATDGIFTPGQFTTAVRQTDRSARKRAVARGTAQGQDLANAARNVLPSSVPDSGTAGRLVTAGLGGGAVAAPQLVVPAIAGGAGVMAAYSPAATRAFQGVMTRQAGPAGRFVDRLLQQAPVSVAAPALLRRPQE